MTSTETAGPARVFLSYARGDDEAFVRRLHADLTASGFEVWFDRESLLSRGLTFHQEIKDAIRTEVDRIVYIGGPKAAISLYVREEWETGLEFDHIVVTPILRLGDYETCVPGELGLLHCEDFRDDAKYEGALSKLVESLRQPNPKLGALFAVPTLPPHFIARPDLLRRVRDALLVDLQKPQVITSADAKVGMQGMGGIGKSVLAAAMARDRQIRQSYPDGIAWIACGQRLTNDDLLARLRDLAKHLGGDSSFTSLPQGQGVLRELLQSRSVLIVLDDVWHAKDAQAFDVLGPRCRMLVTTRDAGILHALNGDLVPVSLFTESESLHLLADAVSTKEHPVSAATLPPEAKAIVKECGCLPLALALCGGMARKRGGDFSSVLERLRRADLDKIADRESINEQHRSIWRAMQASVEMLSADEQNRFAELAVFDTDGAVPAAAAAVLWAHTGQLDDLDTEDLLINLSERSLMQLDTKPDANGKPLRRFRLHDLLHDYAVRLSGDMKALHGKLLDAYRAKCPAGWHEGPNDGYFFQNLCHHFIAREDWDSLIGNDATAGPLSDLLFIQAKCEAGLVHELVTDYNAALTALPEFAEENEHNRRRDAATIAYNQALRDYAVVRCDWWFAKERGEARPEPPYPPLPRGLQEETQSAIPEESSPRAARLRHFANFASSHIALLAANPGETLPLAWNTADEGPICERAERQISGFRRPWLRRTPRPPAHPLRPQCLRTLEGHADEVSSVSVSPDGRRAVSGSSDKTLRVWDLETGQCLRTLEGHADGVSSVSVSPDGRRAVSGSSDKTLRVWALETGQCLHTLEGHAAGVSSVSVSPDGRRAVSGSSDKTLRVWDLETGQCLHTLEGHAAGVWSVSVSPDGRRAVSGSDDQTLRVWDLETGQCLRTLEGHAAWVLSVSVSPDGRRAVSGNDDKTLRVWDLETGQCLVVYQAGAAVFAALFSPDGNRLVCGTADGQMHFLTPINFPPSGPPVVTPVRLWLFGEVRKNAAGAFASAPGRWADDLTCRCAHCGQVFVSNPPSAPVPTCPHCGGALKFNPFVVDGRDFG
ncbi:MAG: TIR domain-containing protein [Kiritimatiellae bacterium]|nr:TIR domain-containing protein [Kiritimatiellia bacterium]